MTRNIFANVTCFLLSIGPVAAQVSTVSAVKLKVPAPETDAGLLALAMVGGAAFLTYPIDSSQLAMVLRGAFWQVGIGLGIGIPAAIGAGYLIANQLFGVTPWNPLLLAGATVLLGLAALFAAMIPARRAAGIDPMQALRSE